MVFSNVALRLNHTSGIKMASWNCAACTYEHAGPESHFLQCKICKTHRENDTIPDYPMSNSGELNALSSVNVDSQQVVQKRIRLSCDVSKDERLGFYIGPCQQNYEVTKLLEGSVAASAGLKLGHIVCEINGLPVSAATHTVDQARELISKNKGNLELGVRGSGRRQDDADIFVEAPIGPRRSSFLGLRLSSERHLENVKVLGHKISRGCSNDELIQGPMLLAGELRCWDPNDAKKKPKERLVVLYEKVLVVAKRKKDGTVALKVVFPFTMDTAIKNVAAYAVTNVDDDYCCVFEIKNRSSVLMLAAKTVPDKEQWVAGLGDQIAHCGGSAISPTKSTEEATSSTSAASVSAKQRWEFPRDAITIGIPLRGTWYRGAIFHESPCMVRVFDPATPTEAIDVEMGILKECRHDNVLALICTVTAPPGPTWMVTELLEMTLRGFLARKGHVMTPSLMASVSLQVCAGISVLHKNNYVHGAVTDMNVLMDGSYGCKLTGFHSSVRLADDQHSVRRSEPSDLDLRWTAPEVLVSGTVSIASDVWGLGVLINVVYARGNKPFVRVPDDRVLAMIQGGSTLPRPPDMHADMYTELLRCCHIHAIKRPRVQELSVMLEKQLAQRAGEPLLSTPVVGAYRTMAPDAEGPPVSQMPDGSNMQYRCKGESVSAQWTGSEEDIGSYATIGPGTTLPADHKAAIHPGAALVAPRINPRNGGAVTARDDPYTSSSDEDDVTSPLSTHATGLSKVAYTPTGAVVSSTAAAPVSHAGDWNPFGSMLYADEPVNATEADWDAEAGAPYMVRTEASAMQLHAMGDQPTDVVGMEDLVAPGGYRGQRPGAGSDAHAPPRGRDSYPNAHHNAAPPVPRDRKPSNAAHVSRVPQQHQHQQDMISPPTSVAQHSTPQGFQPNYVTHDKTSPTQRLHDSQVTQQPRGSPYRASYSHGRPLHSHGGDAIQKHSAIPRRQSTASEMTSPRQGDNHGASMRTTRAQSTASRFPQPSPALRSGSVGCRGDGVAAAPATDQRAPHRGELAPDCRERPPYTGQHPHNPQPPYTGQHPQGSRERLPTGPRVRKESMSQAPSEAAPRRTYNQ
eukprot:m.939998 g.939998  ORF g.939998 m.939998 type:complete len:1081 (+) comp23825_c1_seq3:461-3703(+)